MQVNWACSGPLKSGRCFKSSMWNWACCVHMADTVQRCAWKYRPSTRSPEEGLFQNQSLSWENESLILTFGSFQWTLCLHHVHFGNGRQDLSDEECPGVWDLGGHGSSTTVAAHGYSLTPPGPTQGIPREWWQRVLFPVIPITLCLAGATVAWMSEGSKGLAL